jgi:hypothetical protein
MVLEIDGVLVNENGVGINLVIESYKTYSIIKIKNIILL